MTLGKSWAQKLQGRIEQYHFEVGILDDSPHKFPKEDKENGKPQLGSYANGPIRKTGNVASGMSIGQVFIANEQRMNIDLLARPFREKNSDIVAFTKEFLSMATYKAGSNIRRVENLLQAVVRNPILKQEYGHNSGSTADAKGFDRKLIDTGQMFKAIIARAKHNG